MNKLGKVILSAALSIMMAATLAACSSDTNTINASTTSSTSEKDNTDDESGNKSDSVNDENVPEESSVKDSDYLSGIHHAEIVVENYGTIYVELDADNTPITVTNFVDLANSGFYDGLTFMRVMEGFMIQGGDPNRDCTGGSDTTIKGEFANNGVANNISHKRGTISMARAGYSMDSASSQFFICNADAEFLDGDYAAFGTVTDGMDVVDAITADFAAWNGVIANKDIQPVITTIKIVD